MPLSNDVKWNKIQQIMKLIPSIIKYELLHEYYDEGLGNKEQAAKFAHRDIWILANQIYDVAVDGLDDMIEYFDYVTGVTHWSSVFNKVLSLSEHYHSQTNWYFTLRDICWEQYEYENS